jgi:hypothetical protein
MYNYTYFKLQNIFKLSLFGSENYINFLRIAQVIWFLNSFRVKKFTVKGARGLEVIVRKLFPESRKYFIEKRPGSASRRGKTD